MERWGRWMRNRVLHLLPLLLVLGIKVMSISPGWLSIIAHLVRRVPLAIRCVSGGLEEG